MNKYHKRLLLKTGLFIALVMNVCLPVRYWLETPHKVVVEASNPQIPEPIYIEAKNKIERVSKTFENEIEAYIHEVFGEDGELATAVAMCESRLNPDAINDSNHYFGGKGIDWGIFQLNDYWQADKGDIPNLTWKENVDIAKQIYDDWGNFDAWYCYRNGIHEQFLN